MHCTTLNKKSLYTKNEISYSSLKHCDTDLTSASPTSSLIQGRKEIFKKVLNTLICHWNKWILIVHIWYMLEGKSQRHADTKELKTKTHYIMVITFQLIRGTQIFFLFFCLLLLSERAPLWYQWFGIKEKSKLNKCKTFQNELYK